MADGTPVMTISTPLDDGVLLFHGMHAREELGRLSDFEISLLSEKPDVDIDAILGQSVTVHLTLPEDSVRHFNGFVTRFSAGGRLGRYHIYHARVSPWLWFLTRTADCRIFQEMKVPDILQQVFDDHAQRERRVRVDRLVPQVDLLRAVPRDRLQLRQPADGAGRHLLLLPARGREAHDGADRLDGQARADGGLREADLHSARDDRAARVRARQRLGLLA